MTPAPKTVEQIITEMRANVDRELQAKRGEMCLSDVLQWADDLAAVVQGRQSETPEPPLTAGYDDYGRRAWTAGYRAGAYRAIEGLSAPLLPPGDPQG